MVRPIIKPTDEYENILKGPWKRLLESPDAIVTTHTVGFINDDIVFPAAFVKCASNEILKGEEKEE